MAVADCWKIFCFRTHSDNEVKFNVKSYRIILRESCSSNKSYLERKKEEYLEILSITSNMYVKNK